MCTTDIHLRKFKIQSHLQKRGLEWRHIITLIAKKNHLKNSNITLRFSHKNTLTKLPS